MVRKSGKASSSSGSLLLANPANDSEWERYYDLRWRVLREPWNQPRGSERDELDSKAFHVMLRDPAGNVLAIGRLHLNSPEEAQIRYMAVDESSRGQGLGAQIIQALESEAATQSLKRIVLNAREDVQDFYATHGYRVEGPGPTLFGQVRHIRMRKDLR